MKLPVSRFAPHLLRGVAILVGLALQPGRALAQNTHQTAGIGLGLRGDVVREDLLVPLAFAGPGLQLHGFYRGWVGRGVVSARADVALAFLFNRFGHPGATLTWGTDVAWTFNVLYADAWHLEVGPALAFDNRTSLLFSWDDAHAYWLGSQWLGPAARTLRRLTDTWRLEASAAMALLGFEGRPPRYRYNKQEASYHVDYYFTVPEQSEKFVMLNDLQVVRLDVAVRRAAYNRFDVGRGWSFGLDFRLARTGIPDTNINMSLCAYASRAWGWR
jgi:hypothetical protein